MDFRFGSDTPALVYDKGGGLTPLRGTTAARPSLFFGNPGQEFFVLVDLGDICNIGRNSGSIIPHPGIFASLLEFRAGSKRKCLCEAIPKNVGRVRGTVPNQLAAKHCKRCDK